jgi:hypothetical protein
MLGFTIACCAAGCGGGGAQTTRTDGVSLAPTAARTARIAPTAGAGEAAYSLTLAMRRALSRAGEQPWGEILVRVDTMRNQSHASTGEFEAMLGRLAAALTRAGSSGGVPMRFVVRPGEPVDYELGGAAYLMTAGGFDQWELYVSLRVTDAGATLWSADGAVRMLRQPRGADGLFLAQ